MKTRALSLRCRWLLSLLCIFAWLAGPSSNPIARAQALQGGGAAPDAWALELYAKVHDSVVFIETDTGVGSGFFFHSQRHVATAFHVVEGAEWILVRRRSGLGVKATLAAYDVERDLAILRLDVAFPNAKPLPVYSGRIPVGTPVAAIGHPMSGAKREIKQLQGLLDWSLSRGVVSAVSDDFVQTDTALNPGNSGGPLLDAQGRVVGVVSFQLKQAQGLNVATRADHLQELIPLIGRQPPPPEPAVERDALELGYMLQDDGDQIGGFTLGAGLVFLKHYATRVRAAFVGDDVDPERDSEILRHIRRTSFELDLGYRLHFGEQPWNIALTLGVGAALHFQHDKRTSLVFGEHDGAPTVRGALTRDGDLRLMPQLSATVTFWLLRVGYAFQLPLIGGGAAIHRLLIVAAL